MSVLGAGGGERDPWGPPCVCDFPTRPPRLWGGVQQPGRHLWDLRTSRPGREGGGARAWGSGLGKGLWGPSRRHRDSKGTRAAWVSWREGAGRHLSGGSEHTLVPQGSSPGPRGSCHNLHRLHIGWHRPAQLPLGGHGFSRTALRPETALPRGPPTGLKSVPMLRGGGHSPGDTGSVWGPRMTVEILCFGDTSIYGKDRKGARGEKPLNLGCGFLRYEEPLPASSDVPGHCRRRPFLKTGHCCHLQSDPTAKE